MRRLMLVALSAMLLPLIFTQSSSAAPGGERAQQRADASQRAPDRGRARFRVTTTRDTVDRNRGNGRCADRRGLCSLRAAFQEANARTGATRVILRPGRTYSFTRGGAGNSSGARGDIDLKRRVTLVGRGSRLRLRRIDRAFDIRDGATLNVQGLRVVGGRTPAGESGGSFRSAGKLTFTGSTATKSIVRGEGASGGVIFNDGGLLVVRRSQINRGQAPRAGGGIEANGGRTLLRNAKMLVNRTGDAPGNGGAIHLTGEGVIGVRDSEIERNRAANQGGGLWVSEAGRMAVRGDSVLTRNVADGDEATGGGGALYSDGGALTVESSRLNDNSASGESGSGGAILNNGGSMIVSDSELRRNVANRAGGAIELVAGNTELDTVAMTGNATGDNPGNGGAVHLGGNGTVDVLGSNVRGNVAAAEGGGLWVSAAGTMRVRRTTVTGNTARGAAADQGGGGLYSDGGTLTVDNSDVTGNAADGASGSGGGILNNGGTLLVGSGTSVERNAASRAGGGIEAAGGTTRLDRITLTSNVTGPSPGNGGGLHVGGDGTANVTLSDVRNNTASAEGGGLWISEAGTMTVQLSSVVGNRASGDAADQGGGGLYSDGGTLRVEGSEVNDNVADGAAGSGGGILDNGGTLFVSNSGIRRNAAPRAGGGIETDSGDVEINETVLASNSTGANPGNGGGLHNGGDGTVRIDRSQVIANSAANEGGGLWNSAMGTMTVTNTRIEQNTAADGPQVYNDPPGGNFTIDGNPVAPG